MSTQRLDVRKTYKLCIGGQFVRSESGRVLPACSADGRSIDNFSWASRKDLRDSVVAARNAFEGWAKRTACLRGQILYRAAEMLEKRAAELAHEIARSTGSRLPKARAEVTAAVERLVHYAGWTDKLAQVFGSVNPVATSHFNFTIPEPTGVVAVFAPDEPCLVAFVTLVAAVILSGNAAVAVASDKYPLPALTFAEVLATSDLPAGVVNILAGRQSELATHVAAHLDINAIIDGATNPTVSQALRMGSSHNLKRYAQRSLKSAEWCSEAAEDPYWILDATEFKTVWHPIGV
jgi:acyl-CoA reductase-like NAD-dependent aldehyde dehydrogenase